MKGVMTDSGGGVRGKGASERKDAGEGDTFLKRARSDVHAFRHGHTGVVEDN
jgi:hypothetical protein